MGKRQLIGVAETARYLGVATQTLANWRYHAKGPRFYRVGQLVKYDVRDLDAWLEARVQEGDPAGAA